MKTLISATPIHRGKVIDGTWHSESILGGIDNETVGRVVLTAVSNARKLGWHLGDPETWVRVEFRVLP